MRAGMGQIVKKPTHHRPDGESMVQYSTIRKQKKKILGHLETDWKRETEVHYGMRRIGNLLKEKIMRAGIGPIVKKPTHHRPDGRVIVNIYKYKYRNISGKQIKMGSEHDLLEIPRRSTMHIFHHLFQPYLK